MECNTATIESMMGGDDIPSASLGVVYLDLASAEHYLVERFVEANGEPYRPTATKNAKTTMSDLTSQFTRTKKWGTLCAYRHEEDHVGFAVSTLCVDTHESSERLMDLSLQAAAMVTAQALSISLPSGDVTLVDADQASFNFVAKSDQA